MTLADTIKKIFTHGLETFGRYYGTYEAFVVSNDDPLNMNRLMLRIPILHGNNRRNYIWAQAINSYTGPGYGVFITPNQNDRVMVQFKQGNPRYPMWTHGFVIRGDKPSDFSSPSIKGLVLKNGIKVLFDEDNDTINITTKEGEVIINGGENGGLIITSNMVQQVNSIEDKVNDLINKLKTHTHTGVSPGTSSTAPSTSFTSVTPLTKTKEEDVINEKFKH